MTSYAPPRRPSATRPYDDSPIYTGPQQLQVPNEQSQYYPPTPPQQQPSYQRRRGSSVVSQRSQQSIPSPYLPQPHQQSMTPYGAPPNQQQQNSYFPAASYTPQTPDQLHPDEAYAQDPYQYRQRRESTSSHRSSKSHHSHHSHHSTSSRKSSDAQHRTGRKDGQRATLGDSLFGIWDTLRNVIPAQNKTALIDGKRHP